MAAVTGAVIGGVALANTVVQGRKAADAAKKAGEQQAGATEAGQDEARRQFDITQQNFRPFQQAGADAIEQQRILLGLGGSDPDAEKRAALEAEIESLRSSVTQFQPQKQVFRTVRGPKGSTKKVLVSGGGQTQAQHDQLSAQRDQRIALLTQELEGLSAAPTETAEEQQAAAFRRLRESPGQEFLRRRQEKALLRNASAIGGLGGGNIRTALQEQAAGFASQDIANQFGRLGQVAGQGQAATANLGQFGQQASSNIANLGIAGSQARASGILGQQQARAQTTNQLLQGTGQLIGQIDAIRNPVT